MRASSQGLRGAAFMTSGQLHVSRSAGLCGQEYRDGRPDLYSRFYVYGRPSVLSEMTFSMLWHLSTCQDLFDPA